MRRDKRRSGFSLVEAILAGSILLLLVSFLLGALLYGREGIQASGARVRAAFLAEEGLEAMRNIRDERFENLTDGSYGLVIAGGRWVTSTLSDTTGIFTRVVQVGTLDIYTKQVTSTVTWQESAGRVGNVVIGGRFTNWRAPVASQSDSLVINTSNASIGGPSSRDLLGITIENIGTSPITIDRITVTWDSTRRIEDIIIGGTTVWSFTGVGTPTGRQPSGTVLDIVNYTLPASSGSISINRFRFNGGMTGRTFSITFTMTDGSTKTVGGIMP